jgi:hypothetical protein
MKGAPFWYVPPRTEEDGRTHGPPKPFFVAIVKPKINILLGFEPLTLLPNKMI